MMDVHKASDLWRELRDGFEETPESAEPTLYRLVEAFFAGDPGAALEPPVVFDPYRRSRCRACGSNMGGSDALCLVRHLIPSGECRAYYITEGYLFACSVSGSVARFIDGTAHLFYHPGQANPWTVQALATSGRLVHILHCRRQNWAVSHLRRMRRGMIYHVGQTRRGLAVDTGVRPAVDPLRS